VRNTKKSLTIIAAVAMLACASIMVFAGSVYDRKVVTLPVTTGNATWTNSVNYAALLLKRITYYTSLDTGATVTVTRVTSDGTYTQSVCSIVGAGANSNATTFTSSYLKPGDMLKFAPSTATGGTVIVEYEAQQH
jgi:hypothetical protein